MNRRRKQFHKGRLSLPYYDRKVLHSGYSRLLAVSRIIPKNWRYVRIRILEKSDYMIKLEVERLLENNHNAPAKKTNKKSRKNT